jgi:hypothetical protein
MFFILAILLAGIGFALGPTIIEAYSVPHVQGYANEAPQGQFASLDWGLMAKGDWPQDSKPVMPEAVLALHGQPVTIKGFALPLHEAGEAETLFLAKYPRGCYFCNPPGIADVVVVKVAGERKVPLLNRPVCVYGTFHAATGSDDDEGLYTIADATLVIKRGF